jgi:hypothetical protein
MNVDYIGMYMRIARSLMKNSEVLTPVCWQFVRMIREEYGLKCPCMDEIVRSNINAEPLIDYTLRIEKPVPWSIVLFRVHDLDWHAGVVVPELDRFLHLRRLSGLELTRLSDRVWQKIWHGYYDIR